MNTRYLVSPVVFDDWEKAVDEATKQAEKRFAGSPREIHEVRVQVWVLAGEVVISQPESTTKFEKAE